MNEIDDTELFWQMVWRVVYFMFFAINGYIGYNIIVTHKLYDFYGTNGEQLSSPFALIIGGFFLLASFLSCVRAGYDNMRSVPLITKIVTFFIFLSIAIYGIDVAIYHKIPDLLEIEDYNDIGLFGGVVLGGFCLYISFLFCNGLRRYE